MAPKSEAALAHRREYKREYDRQRRERLAAEAGRTVRATGPKGQGRSEASKQQRREYSRRYKQEHPEQIREAKRRQRKRRKVTDPEGLREADRRSYKVQSSKPGSKERRTVAARNRLQSSPAARSAANAASKRHYHGADWEAVYAAMWHAQDGRCYLCNEPLVPGRNTHFDHDHLCCTGGYTCTHYRRGLACSRCNTVIGHALDDPGLLRRIADNFEPVLKATRARIATKAQQGELWEGAG